MGPTNPRLLPDVSAVGDLVGDLSPKGTTQEDGSRFSVREVEVAIQAAVDPYFRGDIFLGINDLEKISIEQAYLTATALPGFEVRLGRFLMPVGKLNTTHRHDLHSIEYPYIIQRYFSPDGLKGTGIWLSKVFAPFGFYQELQVTVVDRLGEAPEDLASAEPPNKKLSGLGASIRWRNYIDLSQSSNLEISASAATGRREQPITTSTGEPLPTTDNAVNARQSVIGADLTFRWRPLQQGLYRSFILQAEVMSQLNERNPALPIQNLVYLGPQRNFTGGYLFARYQISQRTFVGTRFDRLQDPLANGSAFTAVSGYLEFFPSEFSKLVAGYEYTDAELGDRVSRILLQASFALGPHKPHPF
jgi:hypothetical protein